jgi:hypothetical protein
MQRKLSVRGLLIICAVALASVLAAPGAASAASANDAFYKYTGSTPLSTYKPGTVLRTRTVPYHVLGVPTPLKATQLLYRATNATGGATVNATTVIQPSCLFCFNRDKVISYQSFYDSLNPNDQPSVQIAGGVSLGGMIPQIETVLFAPFLLQGYSIVTTDTQGQTADFAAGPEYGTNTLDGIRAAINSPAVELSTRAKVAMIGYSGGAIATEWAAELAPTYAPELNSNLVGATFGGVLVHPAHNLRYVEGTPIWAGVMPMAIIGIARAYGLNLDPYMSTYGRQLFAKGQNFSIINVLAQYGGLKWTDLVKPEYSVPEKVPEFVNAANKLIMGTGGTPKIPMLIGQGVGGEIEGTPGNKPGIGKGDGVMIAGDVRTLASQYCSKGVRVQYDEYAGSHMLAAVQWMPKAILWLFDRFGSSTAPQNCSKIAPGNSLAPIVGIPSGT